MPVQPEPGVVGCGYAQPEDLAKATLSNFEAHLAKPVEPDIIERLLS